MRFYTFFLIVCIFALAGCGASGDPDRSQAPVVQQKKAVVPVDLSLAESRLPAATPTFERDPFTPLEAGATDACTDDCTPLMRASLDALKVVGVVTQTAQPVAMLEDAQGHGYAAHVGDGIGSDARVVAINRGGVVVERHLVTWAGQRRSARTVLALQETLVERRR